MNNSEQEDLEISGGLSVRPIIERQGRMKMIGSCMKMNIAYILCVTSVGMDWVASIPGKLCLNGSTRLEAIMSLG